ncbi:FMN-binding negative transcriptional regulator [Micromonospora okii]|uniref:FMN-binding negative transcriptional regulator n=1 Tax=Micromonospora okii TaxID=1182970 RepID=UPI001E419114|nr:FMN-binding negative transcriptional regulator [Micromonospora okii]
MFIPHSFTATESDVEELLVHHGAADLITATSNGLEATTLPFVHDPDAGERGALLGHMARLNEHWQRPPVGEAMAIVRGPDTYVTPSWYASKAEHGRVVPTWNYVTAHVYGRLVVHDDADWVADVVRRLTAKHESHRADAWSVDDAPATFITGQLRAVVGVELRITRIEAKAKLSQNKPPADVEGVIAGLTARGDTRSADAVRAAANRRR